MRWRPVQRPGPVLGEAAEGGTCPAVTCRARGQGCRLRGPSGVPRLGAAGLGGQHHAARRGRDGPVPLGTRTDCSRTSRGGLGAAAGADGAGGRALHSRFTFSKTESSNPLRQSLSQDLWKRKREPVRTVSGGLCAGRAADREGRHGAAEPGAGASAGRPGDGRSLSSRPPQRAEPPRLSPAWLAPGGAPASQVKHQLGQGGPGVAGAGEDVSLAWGPQPQCCPCGHFPGHGGDPTSRTHTRVRLGHQAAIANKIKLTGTAWDHPALQSSGQELNYVF